MRNCEVFGIQNLHVIEQKFGKTIDKQIAMGAENGLIYTGMCSTQSCITTLKEQGYQIVATTPHANAFLLDDFDVTKPSALFFGTEKKGYQPT